MPVNKTCDEIKIQGKKNRTPKFSISRLGSISGVFGTNNLKVIGLVHPKACLVWLHLGSTRLVWKHRTIYLFPRHDCA